MPERLGAYELLAPLGAGGTAEVYLARFAGTGGFEKLVVVKRLLPHLAQEREFIDMFLDEARLGARLDQSNIVQTIELGVVDEQYFIALEYVPGLSLGQLARKAHKRHGGLPPAISLALCAQASVGLHYAHERREPDGTPLALVHRDVSPQNLVVNHEGVLKIVDFGIAHAIQEARDARTKSGFIKGKFAYMSPEQCLGKKVDRRTDVFALGTVLHELLTGKRLFKRDTTYRTYQAIVGGEVTVPSQVNPALDPRLDAVVLRALAMMPEDRYPTAEAFGEAIEEALHRVGRAGTPGEVARYLEEHFQAEMAQHDQVVADLFAGKTTSLSAARWDGGEEEPEEAIEEISVAELLEPSGVQEVSDGDVLADELADPDVSGEPDEPTRPESGDITQGQTPRPRRAITSDTTPLPIRAITEMSPRSAPRRPASTIRPAAAAPERPADDDRVVTPLPSLSASEDQPTLAAVSAHRVVLPDHLAALIQAGTATLPVRPALMPRPPWFYPAVFLAAAAVGLVGVVVIRLLIR